MKTVITSSVLLLFIALFAGCVRDEMTPQTGGAGRVLTVSYSFDTPQTRATATGAEREVKDVAIFFYNADDSNPTNETYVDCTTTSIPSESGSSGSFPLPLPAKIVQGNKYKLIIIGNYNQYAPEGKTAQQYAEAYNTRTYSKMKQELQGQLTSDDKRIVTPLPFRGRLTGADGNETTLTGPDPSGSGSLGVSVKFSRAVARFDLINLAADQLKIAWVKVCNYRNKGYFYNESLLPGTIIPGISATAPEGPPYPSGIVAAPEPTLSGSRQQQKLNRGGLYAFPNTVAYTAQDDKLTTYLMIAGYFQKEGGAPNATKLTYYRANVSDNGSSQVLHRNYIYTLAINSVKKEGADTEAGAASEKEKLLDYVTDDSWESDDSGTATDGEGNFLTLSRTSIVLGSEKDESALIKVAVKEGTGWEADWKDDPDKAFRFVKVNDNSFSILTNSDNPGDFTHNATLTVRVTGITATVQLTVNVIQLSSKNDPQMLLVEGKTGPFDYIVPGQGAELSLQVITGSPTSKWKVITDKDLERMLANHSSEGVNKGFINLSFLTNTGGERHGTLTVIRLLPDGTTPDPNVANVVITFNQATSPYIVNLFPDYEKEGLTIDGFLPDNTRYGANGICSYWQFNVLLADPENYTFKATCSLNKSSDAFLTVSQEDITQLAGPLQDSRHTHNPSTVTGRAGESIYLNVFRTGPGDADISGDITVTAVPKPGTGLPTGTYTVPITITSSCKIGDSYVNGVLWADRNVGVIPRGQGGPAVGLNYSSDKNSFDNKNTNYRGGYYEIGLAQGKCSEFGAQNNTPPLNDKWRKPTHLEQTDVAKRMLFSKQRAYIVSDKKNKNGETVGCWFPLAGYEGYENEVTGSYWSSTPGSYGTYYLSLDTRTADANRDASNSFGQSLRCVRTTP